MELTRKNILNTWAVVRGLIDNTDLIPVVMPNSCYAILSCVLYLVVVPDTGNGVVSPPWTADVQRSSQDSSQYLDLPPTVFAPNGRLHSIESATRACDAEYSNSVIAVVCGEGVVVVSSVQTSPYLVDLCSPSDDVEWDSDGLQFRLESNEPSSSSVCKELSLLRPPFSGIIFPGASISNDGAIIGITGGNAVDAQVSRRKLLRICEFARSLEGGICLDIGYVARQIADQQQALTQQGGKGRLLATMILLVSESEIWKIDPNGQYWKCQAAFIGRHSNAVEECLMLKLASKGKNKIQGKNYVWPTFLQQKAVKGRGTNNPQLLVSTLRELSAEEAVTLCARCLSEATHQNNKDITKSPQNKILLQAVVIKSPNQCYYYAPSVLMKLLLSE